VASGDPFRLDLRALKAGIRADRDHGERPACVIATEGTSNTGSIADLYPGVGPWLHVNGCAGALIAIAPDHRHPAAGIERANSLALDLHKACQAPFDVGCILVRDRSAPRLTFAEDAEDLQKMSRDIAAAETQHAYHPDTTRSPGAENPDDAEARWCGQVRTAD
jgi:aromatic-L-amino-acid/L-tryptophan decarboxylase